MLEAAGQVGLRMTNGATIGMKDKADASCGLELHRSLPFPGILPAGRQPQMATELSPKQELGHRHLWARLWAAWWEALVSCTCIAGWPYGCCLQATEQCAVLWVSPS